jgi:hypothetical protein
MVTPCAQTPPMGWNSWDCFGTSVTEAEVVANAEFGPLADRVHALGLRFGVHLMRGIPRRAVAAGLPVLGTGSTAADVADTSSTCEWNGDNVGLDHDIPMRRRTTTPYACCWPSGVSTSSRSTTCWGPTTTVRSRPSRGPCGAAGARWSSACRRAASCRPHAPSTCARTPTCGACRTTCGTGGRTWTPSSRAWRRGRNTPDREAGPTRTCCRCATTGSGPSAGRPASAV